ncbi:MAG: histidine--tRNA ligase [Pseudobdellovibrio sp.]
MSKYQSVRGTRDLLPNVKRTFRAIEQIAYNTALNYGYGEIETPLFEFSDVFHRSLGETSDAVSKETYTFTDRGGDSITLRPEGTAGVVRAFVSEGLAQLIPLKLYYQGPMFRYERPQKGRYRQFSQLGVEVLGLESPLADVECLDLAWNIIKKLNLSERCILEINTLGDTESRADYRQALVTFLTPLKDQLSPDSQIRLEKNPMRILDSKDEGDKKLIAAAPLMENFLNEKSKEFFAKVIQGLEHLKIPYKKNPKLVRGLDYYCHTVFEFTTTELGAQSAILSGGRYDGLVEMLGGSKTAGVGWAAGIDRLADLCESTLIHAKENSVFCFAAIGPKAELEALQLTSALVANNKKCLSFPTGNLKKKLEKISKLTGTAENVYAILIFDQDNGSVEFKVKNFKTGDEKAFSKAEILAL